MSDIPSLGSLGPSYQEDLHGHHADILLKVITDKSGNPTKNVALAGHYGSGKSSVILGLQDKLDEQKVSWVNLSLSSLGIDETERARIQQDGTVPPLTNLIQKEIVKQLLYRKAPANMPGSRYYRIDSFRIVPSAAWSAVAATTFVVAGVLLGLVGRVDKMAPDQLVNGNDWVPWAVVAALGAIFGVVWFAGLRAMQSRVRVESLSAGGAAVSLSAKENSYFDEYLDEIVYFFQRAKTEVAIFEDLDRFKDPHIFETLRELNTVLNNSEQIKSRPIRFVYAVRDSIFSQLGDQSETAPGTAPDMAGTSRAAALETAPHANRTKFFDLVVPMVPFITHRSARDLLAAEFADATDKPSTHLFNLVGAHLTDMRLIRNIRNEFEIYSAAVLSGNGLQGLTADRLFAMMVYKNLHLDDFEAIRLGTSDIDLAHRKFRAMVAYQLDHQTRLSNSLLAEAEAGRLWEKRCQLAGARLSQILPIVHRASRQQGRPVVTYQSTTYDMSELASGEFWESLYESKADVTLASPGHPGTQLSFDEVMQLVGEDGEDMDRAVSADVARLQGASKRALDTKEFVARATMAELMARTDLQTHDHDGEEQSLAEIVETIASPLAHELLLAGYIDENFTLYCSDYHAISISVSAMNFILHSVQDDRADHRFRFDDRSSIEAVEQEMGDRFLGGESVFNLQVFDHYLGGQPDRLGEAIDKLALRASTDTSFLDAYLVDGKERRLLVRQVSDRWTGVFKYLIDSAPITSEEAISLVDAAASGASTKIAYESSDSVVQFFSEHYSQMEAFIGEQADSSSTSGAVTLVSNLNVLLDDITVLGESQRALVVHNGLYPVSRANLVAALAGGTDVALDDIKRADEVVYAHVLANLSDYLHILDGDDVTVNNADSLVVVLNDVAAADESSLRIVADNAEKHCVVQDISELHDAAWNAAVATGRVETTASNVHLFIENFGVSEALVGCLADRDIQAADQLDDSSRATLAYALAGTDALGEATRVSLVRQVAPETGIEPSSLPHGALNLLPELLAEGLVPDTNESYALIADRPFSVRERYFAASANIASYVTEIQLSSDDIAKLMRSQSVPAPIKRNIVEDVEYISARLSRRSAIAICEWAGKGNELPLELLLALAEARAPAESILDQLTRLLPQIEQGALDRLLVALGDDYEPLTRFGHHRPRLKERAGTEELLSELQKRNRVSSFGPAKFLGGIRVNMRHG